MAEVTSLDEVRARRAAQEIPTPAELVKALEGQTAHLRTLREHAADTEADGSSVAYALLEWMLPTIVAFRNEIKEVIKLCSQPHEPS